MGKRAGVWALDVDTSEDHADGWRVGKLTAQHDQSSRANIDRQPAART